MTTLAGNSVQALRIGATDTVTVGAASAQSAVLGDRIDVVRVVSTTNCFISQGSNPTATTSSMYLPADVPEYFRVNRNDSDRFAVIQETGGGTLYITTMD